MTNLRNGADQYRTQPIEKVMNFSFKTEAYIPLQICTAKRGELVVCGGDDGFVRIFERQTGGFLEKLPHSHSSFEMLYYLTLINQYSFVQKQCGLSQ